MGFKSEMFHTCQPRSLTAEDEKNNTWDLFPLHLYDEDSDIDYVIVNISRIKA